jgi:hypothetical protein
LRYRARSAPSLWAYEMNMRSGMVHSEMRRFFLSIIRGCRTYRLLWEGAPDK